MGQNTKGTADPYWDYLLIILPKLHVNPVPGYADLIIPWHLLNTELVLSFLMQSEAEMAVFATFATFISFYKD